MNVLTRGGDSFWFSNRNIKQQIHHMKKELYLGLDVHKERVVGADVRGVLLFYCDSRTQLGKI